MALKTSRFARLSKIAGLGATVLGKSLQGALTAKSELETRIAQARSITKTLAELKGASMKLGQMLSIQGESFLPPEVTEILSLLQNSAPPFSGDEMKALLKLELKEAYGNVASFDKTPLAAASIGQVHRGRLITGEEVVFKIQYPGIAKAIDSEVSLLKNLLIPLFKTYARNLEVDHVVEEFRDLLKQEVDYVQEARHLQYFRESLKDDERFVVPQAFNNLTTKNVITMSYEPGENFKKFAGLEVTPEVRNDLGLAVYELLMDEIFKYRTVQTDPNFGNYLIRIDGQKAKTVLLDFGSCRTYAAEFVEDYRLFLRAVALGDREKMLRQSYKMKLIDEGESAEAKEVYYALCQLAIAPFVSAPSFNFKDSDYPKKINELSFKLMKKLNVLPAPRELIFLNRKLGGVYNYCRALGVNASFRPVLKKVLDF